MLSIFLVAGMVGLAAMYPLAARLDEILMRYLDRVILGLIIGMSAFLLLAYWIR